LPEKCKPRNHPLSEGTKKAQVASLLAGYVGYKQLQAVEIKWISQCDEYEEFYSTSVFQQTFQAATFKDPVAIS